MNKSLIYALDFDGVLCDSVIETAITGWKAASSLWPDMPKEIPDDMIERFRLVRLIIETGYESILAMRLLHQGQTISDIESDYQNVIQALLKETNVSVDDLKRLFGQTRDQWIADDLKGWLNMNPLFPGIARKLQKLGRHCTWYIVTTKQERFVKQILQANGIALADDRIFGLDRQMSKVEVLTQLLATHSNETICFVEDRLPTLMNVYKNEHLAPVKLFFALWGYNTLEDKSLAASKPITLIHLDDFLEF